MPMHETVAGRVAEARAWAEPPPPEDAGGLGRYRAVIGELGDAAAAAAAEREWSVRLQDGRVLRARAPEYAPGGLGGEAARARAAMREALERAGALEQRALATGAPSDIEAHLAFLGDVDAAAARMWRAEAALVLQGDTRGYAAPLAAGQPELRYVTAAEVEREAKAAESQARDRRVRDRIAVKKRKRQAKAEAAGG